MDLISFGQGVQTNGIRAFTQGDLRQWKFNADVEFYRYLLSFEAGEFERVWIAPGSTYLNKGTFYKIGPDINFLHRDPDHTVLFIGFRYARSNYEDFIVTNYSNVFWGDGEIREANQDLSSRWFELTTGIKVKLYKFIWSGYTARFKFMVNENHANNALAPHWIPGYGRSAKESNWGFEYWIMIRIPFRKYPPLPEKE